MHVGFEITALFHSPIRWGTKRGNFKTIILFDFIESFLYSSQEHDFCRVSKVPTLFFHLLRTEKKARNFKALQKSWSRDLYSNARLIFQSKSRKNVFEDSLRNCTLIVVTEVWRLGDLWNTVLPRLVRMRTIKLTTFL